MLKKLRVFHRSRPRKRWLNMKTEYEYLKQILLPVNGDGVIWLTEEDLSSLSKGTSVFLWESPLAESAEEAAEMARWVAQKPASSPGGVILSAILSVFTDTKPELDTIEQIANPLERVYSEETEIILSVNLCPGQKGIRFVLAVSEEKFHAIKQEMRHDHEKRMER